MLKKRKGEIATLLTLGLVLVGTLITLGASLFVSNKKTNLVSNSRAACAEEYVCGTITSCVKRNTNCSNSPADLCNCAGKPCNRNGQLCGGGGGAPSPAPTTDPGTGAGAPTPTQPQGGGGTSKYEWGDWDRAVQGCNNQANCICGNMGKGSCSPGNCQAESGSSNVCVPNKWDGKGGWGCWGPPIQACDVQPTAVPTSAAATPISIPIQAPQPTTGGGTTNIVCNNLKTKPTCDAQPSNPNCSWYSACNKCAEDGTLLESICPLSAGAPQYCSADLNIQSCKPISNTANCPDNLPQECTASNTAKFCCPSSSVAPQPTRGLRCANKRCIEWNRITPDSNNGVLQYSTLNDSNNRIVRQDNGYYLFPNATCSRLAVSDSELYTYCQSAPAQASDEPQGSVNNGQTQVDFTSSSQQVTADNGEKVNVINMPGIGKVVF